MLVLVDPDSITSNLASSSTDARAPPCRLEADCRGDIARGNRGSPADGDVSPAYDRRSAEHSNSNEPAKVQIPERDSIEREEGDNGTGVLEGLTGAYPGLLRRGRGCGAARG